MGRNPVRALTIDKKRKNRGSNASLNAGNPNLREVHKSKGSKNNIPFNRIIGLLYVDLKKHPRGETWHQIQGNEQSYGLLEYYQKWFYPP